MATRRKHGLCSRNMQSPKYAMWCAIKRRCYCVTHPSYANYGGRGITMYEPWRHDFALFDRDVPDRPAPGLTLDREDNDRGYEPGNLRWVTYKIQNLNRRRVGPIGKLLEYRGEQKNLSDWCRELGLNYKTAYWRLSSGWTVEEVLEQQKSGKFDLFTAVKV